VRIRVRRHDDLDLGLVAHEVAHHVAEDVRRDDHTGPAVGGGRRVVVPARAHASHQGRDEQGTTTSNENGSHD
jgi:hypothetical protein